MVRRLVLGAKDAEHEPRRISGACDLRGRSASPLGVRPAWRARTVSLLALTEIVRPGCGHPHGAVL